MTMTRLVLHQTLRYDYPSPVRRLRHHLMVVPPARHGDQVRIASALEVTGAEAEVTESVDAFGNVAIEIRAGEVQECVEFDVRVVVERGEEPGRAVGPAAEARRLLVPSPLTEPDAALCVAARRLVDSGDGGLALADRSTPGWRRR